MGYLLSNQISNGGMCKILYTLIETAELELLSLDIEFIICFVFAFLLALEFNL